MFALVAGTVHRTVPLRWVRILSSIKDLAEGYPEGILQLNGPDDRIRTCGILLPKQALYQTEPHPGIYEIDEKG